MTKRIAHILAAVLITALMISCGGDTADDDSAKKAEADKGLQRMTAQSPAVQAKADAAKAKAEIPKGMRVIERQQTSTVGKTPEDGAVVLSDLDGKRRPLTEWVGKQPTIVNLWGTWCPPCRREIPGMVELYKEYRGKGVEIVGVAFPGRDTPDKVRDFAKKAGMEWVMTMGDKSVARPLQWTGSVPTTIFYDKNGREVERFVGARDHATFKAAVEKMLN